MGKPDTNLRERTFQFACQSVVFCRELSKEPGVRRQIAGQLLRSATSVGANAEEAKAAYSRKEFACKNNVVLREARESHFWLRVIDSTELVPAALFKHLLEEADELVAIYTTIVRKCRTS